MHPKRQAFRDLPDKEKMTGTQIARTLGVGRGTVLQWMQQDEPQLFE